MKQTILLLMGLVLYVNYASSQCFTQIDSLAAKNLEQKLKHGTNRNYGGVKPIIRLAIHRVTAGNGTGGITWQEIEDWVNTLPDYFGRFNICFTVVSKDEVANDDYYPFVSFFSIPTLRALSLENRQNNAINIYFLELVGTPGGVALGGWLTRSDPSLFPSVMVSKYRPLDISQSQLNTGTLSHEIGHVLGLYHTHEENLFGTENIPRTGNDANCSATGDLLCGTPADPNLNLSYNLVNDEPGCEYLGGGSRGGYAYAPDTRNVMSYSLVQCLNHFSDDQGERMVTLLQTTDYLDSQVVPWNEVVTATLPLSSNQTDYYYSVQNDMFVSENESNGFLVNSGNVVLEAVHKVVLQPGFKASSGSSVLVKLGQFPCNTPLTHNSAKTDETVTHPDKSKINGSLFLTYPNPANVQCNLEINLPQEQTVEIILTNLLGSTVKIIEQASHKEGKTVIPFNTSEFASGIYFINFYNGQNRVVKKLVIERN